MGVNFVIPGPWKIQKPMGVDFHLGNLAESIARKPAEAPPSVATGKTPAIESGAVAPSGKTPLSGGLPLRAKHLLAQARPLLHILLLCAPTLASALLAGRRPTLLLAILTSLAIEGAQIAFGYGFDWIDVIDLATDATGIALGLWLLGRLCAISKQTAAAL
jgi:hypothetical protein